MDYFKFILSMLIYGSVGIFSVLIPMKSGNIVFSRALVGSLILFLVIILKRERVDRQVLKKNMKYLAVSGLCMGMNWVFFLESHIYTSVSIGTLIYYLAPAIVIILSHFVFKDRLNKGKIVGISLSLLGMFLINFSSDYLGTDPVKGISFGLLAAFLYAIVMIVNKFIEGVPGLIISAIQLSFAGLAVFIYLLINRDFPFSLPSGKPLLYLMILCVVHTALAVYLFLSGLQNIPAQNAALLTYVDPVSALIFSALILNERLSLVQILGAAMILFGAAYGQKSAVRVES